MCLNRSLLPTPGPSFPFEPIPSQNPSHPTLQEPASCSFKSSICSLGQSALIPVRFQLSVIFSPFYQELWRISFPCRSPLLVFTFLVEFPIVVEKHCFQHTLRRCSYNSCLHKDVEKYVKANVKLVPEKSPSKRDKGSQGHDAGVKSVPFVRGFKMLSSRNFRFFVVFWTLPRLLLFGWTHFIRVL